MTLSTNGSNGQSSHEALTRPLTAVPMPDYRDERPAYAGALIIGPLTDQAIVELMRRGLAVRPFLSLDSVLTGLFVGQSTDVAKPVHERANGDRTSPSAQERPVEIGVAPSKVPDRTYDGEFASQICKQLDPSLPNGPIREFFHLCAAKTRKRLTVDQAAQAIGVERVRLSLLLGEGGYPEAHEVLRWMRLLHACWLLSRTPKRSVEEVAKSLAFASGPSMSNTMSNVLGVRPAALAERGGYNTVLAQFRRKLDQAQRREVQTEPQQATA